MNKIYKKYAKKILTLTSEEANNHLKLIQKFNGSEEVDKILTEISSILAEVGNECLR